MDAALSAASGFDRQKLRVQRIHFTLSPVKAAPQPWGKDSMFRYALIFFVISIVLGFLGFGRASTATGSIAKILFVVALIIAVIFVVVAFAIGRAVF
jgi:uncharacterized membrane protein YtjA (UPF0391 family)